VQEEEDWSSREAGEATRKSLGGCVTYTLIAFAALALLGYLVAVVIDLLS